MIEKQKDKKRYYSKYSAVVFDNNDPNKRGRIKAYVPKVGFTVEGAGPTAWALPVLDHPGKWFGPPVNTKIWIEFEGGDPNIPIWSGAFVGAPGGKSELPLRAQGTDDGTEALKGSDTFNTATGTVKTETAHPFAPIYPSNNVIALPNGIRIEYDDTLGKERVLILHPSGSFIEMYSDGKVTMKVADEFWNKIAGDLLFHVLGDKFETVVGNVEEKATQRIIEATAIKLGSTSTLSVMLSSIITKFNAHTHNVTAVGSPTGPPLAPNTYIPGTDSTTKVKAE